MLPYECTLGLREINQSRGKHILQEDIAVQYTQNKFRDKPRRLTSPEGMGSYQKLGTSFQFHKMKRILEMDDTCKTMQMCIMLWSCTPTNISKSKFTYILRSSWSFTP